MSQPLWRSIQARNIRSFKALTEYLGLETDQLAALDIDPEFPINIPGRLVDKMEKGNVLDPIFLQFIPQRLEQISNGKSNPVGDVEARFLPRLLRKYRGRALLVTTGACAMHCRYCFRKEFPYAPLGNFAKEIDFIAKDRSIREVILSGGDPLSLSDRVLGELLKDIDAIEHVDLIRFHTRFPIGIPERIDDSFLSLLDLKSQVWFVIHANHAREIDADVAAVCKKIQKKGIPVLNQSVLLRGVNDTLESHKTLLERLISCGIQPYYLHQLDPVTGTGHFAVSIDEGLELIEALRSQLPGYAIPNYVQEIAGESSKRPLNKSSHSSALAANLDQF